MNRQAVFFDLDDTILWDEKSIKTAFARTCAYAEDAFGADAETLETEVRKAAAARYAGYPSYTFTQQIGINPFEGLWGTFDDEEPGFSSLHSIIRDYQYQSWADGLQALGLTNPAAAEDLADRFIQERKQAPFLFEDAIRTVEQLRGRAVLVLLTNGSPQLQRTKLTMTPEIEPLFDHVIISGAFGRGKPDAAIFEHALEVSGTDPSSTWMIGDNPKTDILGANRTGITSVWLNRFNKQPVPDIQADHEIHSLEELLDLIPS
ncbi:HAD family hydrolase [Alkalicoccus chagannorensis]|uniref:HAD family hydrolase n=1 Tax=Alkalicoccus chagannorensis TaxID=427072 RepID=UPI000426076F|nr:HAD family hydrolase [Alkalicoccus chagannorensis]